MGTETALDGDSGVVEDDTARNTAVILEGTDNGIQKTLQILPLVSNDVRGAAVTQPGTEQVYNQLLTVDVDGCLTPVDLDGLSRSETNTFVSFRAARISWTTFRTEDSLPVKLHSSTSLW